MLCSVPPRSPVKVSLAPIMSFALYAPAVMEGVTGNLCMGITTPPVIKLRATAVRKHPVA